MNKSPIDELFNELYGYYPNKSGQSFEMIVAAAFKLLMQTDIGYDQRIRGDFSETVYQLDGLIESKSMIEAKDFTIHDKKVGRDDIQKLQGALTDLPIEKGIFASATDYTKPAQKYADSSLKNPMQKPIELFHIRPSTLTDETGRIKKIVINMSMHIPNYTNSKMQLVWTKDGVEKLIKNDLANKNIPFSIDRFYDKNGLTLETVHDLTKFHPPGTNWEKDFVAKGCWIIRDGFIKYENDYYPIIGLEYEVPYSVTEPREIVVESDGNPRLYIKNMDGSIDKLISDKDLKKVKFEDGKVILT